MKILLAPLLIAVSLPAFAAGDVAPEIHDLCIKAADYRGCVEAQKGTPEYLGNKCKAGYAYVGAGNCQKVTCSFTGIGGGDRHDPIVAGKSNWKCGTKINWWSYSGIDRGHLKLGAVSPITQSKDCPSVEPKIGWNSSCEHAKPGWKAEAEAEAKRPKCDAKLVPFECDWDVYLEANPATKAWAVANPAMAEQERIKMTADPQK